MLARVVEFMPSLLEAVKSEDIHGGAFRVNNVCRLHVTYHERSVAMVSYILMATMSQSAPPIHVSLVIVLDRPSDNCL